MNGAIREADYIKSRGLLVLGIYAGYYLAGVVGAATAFLIGNGGVGVHTVKLICGAEGLLISILWSYLCFRFVVRRVIVGKAR